uniref:Uncharacterized protein n=1 Tax=Arundo donax TaxID=35708 RepID=A0A0A8YFD7_ARUDO
MILVHDSAMHQQFQEKRNTKMAIRLHIYMDCIILFLA